jgi:hypothetical protein
MTFRKVLMATVVVSLALVSLALKCKEDPSGGDSIQITDFCLGTNDISGWAAWSNECTMLIGDDLYGTSGNTGGINGGAPQYINNGLIEYIYQELTSGGKRIRAYVMDFQNAANAQTMFDTKRAEATEELAIGGYALNEAIVDVKLTAYEVYAHIDQYYFWFQMEGLSDSDEARSTAKQFLDLYAVKM